DPNWANTCSSCDDDGGVHTNLGVGDYWFYLLSESGSGVNENGEHYSVSKIGIEDAAEIIYHALTSHYITSTTKYPDYREATIRAAEDLYGSCSNEAIQVAKAWNAVGVGSTLDAYDTELCSTISAYILGIPYPVYKGINSVVSPGSSCTSATVDLSSGSVTFAGGNFVVLKEGFSVSGNGSNFFTAMTDECSYTYHLRTSQSDVENEQSGNENLLSNNDINVFPNPFSSTINFKYSSPVEGKLKIAVTDIQGRTVKSFIEDIPGNNIEKQFTLDLANISPGIYMMRVSDGINTSVQKIIKS
ncbi:MAG: M4 family metallopeptidase, partial [Bacteroidota bacterium]